ncbi:MAG: response regulator transcription factor [Opitutales bacterium]|nr:response regulator transcription factor [Opitutales bacterium]
MTQQRILIIEDDEDISELLAFSFTREKFDVRVDGNGLGIRGHLEAFKPDLIVLDLMLPGIDGRRVCDIVKRDQAYAHTHVMVVSARDSEESVLDCYQRGADEFLRKPFSSSELVLRAKTPLKRKPAVDTHPKSRDSAIHIGPLSVHRQRRIGTVDGHTMRLTHSEYLLLELMAKAPGRIFSREQFARHLSAEYEGAHEGPSFRNIDVHILAIRKQLGDWRSIIGTARGVGYFLRPVKAS